MADSPTSDPADPRSVTPQPTAFQPAAFQPVDSRPPGTAAVPPEPPSPATRADLAGFAHQVRTEMAHLRRDLAQRLDAANERLEAVLARRHARLGLALVATQCLVTVLSVAVLRLMA